MSHSERTRFIGGLPERGIWTAVELTRGQFFGILALSLVLFLLVQGPVWSHVRESHLARIVVSYAVIPLGVALALHRNGSLRLLPLVAASGVLALVKLVLTAALLIAIALAGG
jgi:hypothetical protein